MCDEETWEGWRVSSRVWCAADAPILRAVSGIVRAPAPKLLTGVLRLQAPDETSSDVSWFITPGSVEDEMAYSLHLASPGFVESGNDPSGLWAEPGWAFGRAAQAFMWSLFPICGWKDGHCGCWSRHQNFRCVYCERIVCYCNGCATEDGGDNLCSACWCAFTRDGWGQSIEEAP